jgi:tRNA(Ile)-lysidine synthase
MESGFPSLLLFSVASPFGFTESQLHNLLEGLSDTRMKIFFSLSHQLVKNRNTIVISLKTTDNSENELVINDFDSVFEISDPIPLKFRKLLHSDDFRFSADPCRASLDLDRMTFPLHIRKWRKGDEFRPLGLNGRKKISDFFADQKFSQEDKENCRLLCCGPDVVWIIGHRIGHRYRITSHTSRILDIFFG